MALDKTGGQSLEFLISHYFDVHQLSASVRQKWEQATVIGNVLCTCSLDEIARRQQAAELNRLVSLLDYVLSSETEQRVAWGKSAFNADIEEYLYCAEAMPDQKGVRSVESTIKSLVTGQPGSSDDTRKAAADSSLSTKSIILLSLCTDYCCSERRDTSETQTPSCRSNSRARGVGCVLTSDPASRTRTPG